MKSETRSRFVDDETDRNEMQRKKRKRFYTS
jgi:hypothetical protein